LFLAAASGAPALKKIRTTIAIRKSPNIFMCLCLFILIPRMRLSCYEIAFYSAHPRGGQGKVGCQKPLISLSGKATRKGTTSHHAPGDGTDFHRAPAFESDLSKEG
jgi:hypothetical protein